MASASTWLHFIYMYSARNLECSCADSRGQDTSPSQVHSQQCWYSCAAEYTAANRGKLKCLRFKREPCPVWGSNPRHTYINAVLLLNKICFNVMFSSIRHHIQKYSRNKPIPNSWMMNVVGILLSRETMVCAVFVNSG